MKKLLFLSLIMLAGLSLSAQDLIVRKNPKAEISCKIVEIGEDLVYYSAFLGGEERRFSIDKNNIEYIKFANGEILRIGNSMFAKNHYQDNTNNAIKLNFLSPLMGFSEFEYERSVKPGQSWAASLGIIGLGLNTLEIDAIGFSLAGGYRFYRSPDYYVRNMKYAHILKGSYIMPKIKFSLMNANIGYYDYSEYGFGEYTRQYRNIATLNLLITAGKQWVFANRFLIDLNIGFGYGFSNLNDDYDYELGLFYGVGNNFTYSSSLKIGYLFHDRKQPKTMIPQ